jgi:hypothetical protein
MIKPKQRTQNALSLVSYLFLLVGLIAFFGMLFHAIQGDFHVSFGILGIGIFAGLRKYSRAWRFCALAFTWYGIVTLSIALLFCLADHPTVAAPILFSQRFAQIPAEFLSIPLVLVLLVTLWQYRILTHPAVRRLFYQRPGPSAPRLPNAVAAEPAPDGVAWK